MSRLDHAKDLIRHCKDLLPQITVEYESSLKEKQVEARLLIDIKNFMENLRSALDYSANEIFMKYGHSPKAKPRIYFPYIQAGQTHTDFRKRFEECMPGVLATRPGIVPVLEAYQPLSSGDNWLPLFMEICNDNKHQDLTPQIYAEDKGMMITVGNQKLRIVGGMHIAPGGRFIVDGKVVPPGTYNADNLPPLDPPASAEVITWKSFFFSSHRLEVLPFLQKVLKEIESIVNSLALA